MHVARFTRLALHVKLSPGRSVSVLRSRQRDLGVAQEDFDGGGGMGGVFQAFAERGIFQVISR